MLYSQNGGRIVAIDAVTSLHRVYTIRHENTFMCVRKLSDNQFSFAHGAEEQKINENKKLSYRRETARRAVLVKTVRSVARMFVELHFISPETGE